MSSADQFRAITSDLLREINRTATLRRIVGASEVSVTVACAPQKKSPTGDYDNAAQDSREILLGGAELIASGWPSSLPIGDGILEALPRKNDFITIDGTELRIMSVDPFFIGSTLIKATVQAVG